MVVRQLCHITYSVSSAYDDDDVFTRGLSIKNPGFGFISIISMCTYNASKTQIHQSKSLTRSAVSITLHFESAKFDPHRSEEAWAFPNEISEQAILSMSSKSK